MTYEQNLNESSGTNQPKEYLKGKEMEKEFIAHRRESDGESQSLLCHLLRTSIYAGQFANKIGLKKAGRILGLLHDLGKASEDFQKYIHSVTGRIDPDADDYKNAKGLRGKIDHSSAGAQLIYRKLSKKGQEGFLAGQILSHLHSIPSFRFNRLPFTFR